jgi:proline racemase
MAKDGHFQHAAGNLAFVADPDWSPRRRARQRILVVGCHAGGEVGLVVVAGVGVPAGESVYEVMDHLRSDDTLRRLLLREPRGSVAQHANLVVPSNRADCEAGFVIMEPTEYPAMSGSNTMCVATVLLETGIVPMATPVTRLQLEAPGGPVAIEAACDGGRVSNVTIENVPSFAERLDAPVELAGVGTISADLAYGGMWYAIVDAGALGFALDPSEARDLAALGDRIRQAAREQLDCRHPENDDIAGVSIVQFAGPWRGLDQESLNAVVVAPGRLDRSATGTGLSARMAVLHARGLMGVEDSMAHCSVIGSVFHGRILSETSVGPRTAIVPAISGQAWITGITEVLLDPTDPFPEGYLLSDTWPGSDRQEVPFQQP